jgi:hypothetical protein
MVPMPDEIADSARIGVGATIDGIVPFADPMKNSLGTYNDCETGAKESRFLGGLSRDIGLIAAGGPLSGSKRFILPKAAKGTNMAGIFFRSLTRTLKVKKLPFPVPTPVGYPPNLMKRYSADLGTIAGRYTPWLGAGSASNSIANGLQGDCHE